MKKHFVTRICKFVPAQVQMYIQVFVARMFRIQAFLIISFLISSTLFAFTEKIDRQIEPGQIHSNELNLMAGEFVSVLIEEVGIDLTASLYSPEGLQLLRVDLNSGTGGEEPIFFVAPTEGKYRIEITPSLPEVSDKSLFSLQKLQSCSYKAIFQTQSQPNSSDLLQVAALSEISFAETDQFNRSEKQTFESIKDLFNAAELSKQSGNQSLHAKSLEKLSELYQVLSRSAESINFAEQALDIYKTLNFKKGIAETLNTMGTAFENVGEYQKALNFYEQALQNWKDAGDKHGEAIALNNIGLHCFRTGDLTKALDYYDHVLPIWEETGDWMALSNTFSAMGLAYSSLSENQKAISYFNEALPLQHLSGDCRSEASTLNNVAMLLVDLGDLQKALDYLNHAEEIRQEAPDRRGDAAVLNNLGIVYQELGEIEKALDYYTRALELRKESEDKAGEASTLNNLGKAYEENGKLDLAEKYFQQSLDIAHAIGMKSVEAQVLNNLGDVYQKRDDLGSAFDYYNQALELRRKIEDRQGEAEALDSLGSNLLAYGELQKAARMYGLALQLRRQIGDKPGEAESLFHIASLKRRQGQLISALDYIDSCISIVESLRVRVLSQNLRASFFGASRKYYELYQNLLFELHQTEPTAGYDARAFHVSERSRARGLMELLAESSLDLTRGVEPGLLLEERAVREELNSKLDRQMRLLSSGDWPEEAVRLGEEIESLNMQYEQIEATIRRTNPHYAEIMKPEPLTLQHVQDSILDDDTVLLEFSLGDEKSFVWAVSRHAMKSAELPPRDQIEHLALSLYQQLSEGPPNAGRDRAIPASIRSRRKDVDDTAIQLSHVLFDPIMDELDHRRILVVADGPLHFVPFAALSDPRTDHLLAVDHEVVNTPSASTLSVLRKEIAQREPPNKTIAVFADPVFEMEDERMKPSTFSDEVQLSPASIQMEDVPLTRLPFTRREAQAILSLVPEDKSLKALDFQASRELILSPEIQNYKYVHLATHGFLNSILPEQSGIILSLFYQNGHQREGFVSAGDIFNLRLKADLVVLSACRTALGKQVRGEGIMGLARAFLYAGAARVVASLWKVDDVATAEFMQTLYEGMLGDAHLSPPEALRAAQLKMMNDPRWKSPYYWAAFVLQGDY